MMPNTHPRLYAQRQKVKNRCSTCGQLFEGLIGEHIRSQHGEEDFKQAVIRAKEGGIPDQEIGAVFGINFKQLQEIITEKYGANISVLKKTKRLTHWEPKNFREETTTVWSYKQRGNWATHNGRYRGNWSPYIPRNVILKYSQPGDVVLDYFVGGGTTAVEAKLLGRRCIARDINPACVSLTLENLRFLPPRSLFSYPIYEPEVEVGDARDLSNISDNSIDLICAHPPYAGIINYSSNLDGDLSNLGVKDFLNEMQKVASESYRVLKPGKKCAILIGDTRKHKHIVPIGFQTINIFLEAGFKLKELVIKRQHNCKTTGFWYKKSIKYNFLLLAHEYLPIFEKPEPTTCLTREDTFGYSNVIPTIERPIVKKVTELETTTIWVFPEKGFEERLNKNVVERYAAGNGYSTIVFNHHFRNKAITHKDSGKRNLGLLFVKSPFLKGEPSRADLDYYLSAISAVVKQNLPNINPGGFIVIQTQDTRINGYLEPLAKRIVDTLSFDNLLLKEIVVATQEGANSGAQNSGGDLIIAHQYLLVYEKKK